MINNDVLRRLRYTLKANDAAVVDLFAQGGATVTEADVAAYISREDEPGFVELPDGLLDAFLDGLIVSKRGKREGAPPPRPARFDNNLILRKLKIALNLREEDMLAIFALAEFRISSGELSAFFRGPDHRNHRPCKDQALRNFLVGLSKKLRP
jgi:uncharacterized protein YehS (DUF1456 family)